jgi:hypothetical protein
LRKSIWVAAIVALAAPVIAFAAEPSFSPERFRAHVAFLADDMLEGREPGTRGHELAARYVASQFDLLGLKPAGENGGWYQQVQFAEARLSDAPASVTISGPAGANTFAHGGQAVVRGLAKGGPVEVKAPAVFVGYGAVDPARGIDDYKGADVRGRVAVLFRAVDRGNPDSEIAAHQRAVLYRTAAQHGAVGVVIIRTRAQGRAAWRPTAEAVARVQTNWIGKDGSTDDPDIPVVSLDPAAAEALFAGSLTPLATVFDIVEKGAHPPAFALATTVEVKATTQVRRYSSPEVIGLIPGTDPRLKSEYIVLMAHLDHLGVRNDGRADPIFNGALDNATGIATLLEVGRAFQARPPRRSVLLIANTGEEKGLIGAQYFAAYPTVPIDKIVAGIDLDMPVLTYAFTDVVAYGGPHSTLDRVIDRAAASMGIKVSPDWQPDQAIFVRSDHYALVRAGIPAVMLSTGEANGGQAAWATYFSKNYHQPSDDMNQPIRWDQGARFAELNYRIVRQLADRREAPRWYAGDYFGDLYAPKAAKVKR